jgi:hypothetical protein
MLEEEETMEREGEMIKYIDREAGIFMWDLQCDHPCAFRVNSIITVLTGSHISYYCQNTQFVVLAPTIDPDRLTLDPETPSLTVN